MKPSEVLREAIRQIQKRGWCQGSLYLGDETTGPVCAVGAMRAAVDPSNRADLAPPLEYDSFEPYRKARWALRNVTASHQTIPGFNDAVKTTRPMVLRKMSQAARALEAEGR